jgi:diamine N-acetyltransferase
MTTDENPTVTLREITRDNVHVVLKLEVDDDQKRFVASNAYSIAEACFSKTAWFRAIYAGETPVGFVMLALDREDPEYSLWRFMIDKAHQGHGYGSQAMGRIIEFVRQQPGAEELTLSYVPGQGCPAPFYAKLGFEETGEWDDDERIMRLAL